jgi:hypothetical protein
MLLNRTKPGAGKSETGSNSNSDEFMEVRRHQGIRAC